MTIHRPPVNYYTDYFLAMTTLVNNRYGDLLRDVDQTLLKRTTLISAPALRLLIRLYMRKGPNFLVNKLNYPEVPTLKTALAELIDTQLVIENPVVYPYELASLLPIAEARTLFSTHGKEKKSDLVSRLYESDELKTCQQWGVTTPIITPNHYDSYRRLQLLYFGTERQTLTDFVLEDIGLFKYEDYTISRQNRLFNNAKEVDLTIELNDLSTGFYLMNDAKDWCTLPEMAIKALELQPPTSLQRKWHRLLNRIGLRLELIGELDLAEELFRTNDLPLSRERRTRILYKKKNYQAAFELLETISSNPKSTQEISFYSRFINKLTQKLSLPYVSIKKTQLSETHLSWVKGEGTIEQQACQHIEGAQWVENSLPNAIFGLIYWQVIFSDASGVWHHPFQQSPTDLYDSDFTHARKPLITTLCLQKKEIWRENLIEYWRIKYGIRNAFVNWNALTLDIILDCFDSLTKTQWLGVFEHLLSDLKQYRSGFPDLFKKTSEGYCFIEIKGPGDRLQDNQILWLSTFKELGINSEVCYVSYIDET